MCLAWRNQQKILTTDTDLLEAGLGEKLIEFPTLDISGEELKEILYSNFPKLRDGGGYQLCRNLEELTAVSHSSLAMLKERVGNGLGDSAWTTRRS